MQSRRPEELPALSAEAGNKAAAAAIENDLRKVSLVIPLRDEGETVAALLQSVAAQKRLPDEVVVVDAGSTDRTQALVRGFTAPFPLVVVPTGRLFPGEARNEGVARASHEWIAFTDGGIELEPHWLHELIAAAKAEADVVLGAYEPICSTLFRECAALAYISARGPSGLRGPSVASLLLRRSVFSTIGGFPAYRASEDLIFLERILEGPFRIVEAPTAIAKWRIPGDVGTLFRRFALYSTHNLIAGRGRFWHLGLMRQYVVLFLSIVGLLVSGLGVRALLVVPFWFLIRGLKAAWQKRDSFSFNTFHPARFGGAAVLLAVLDAATMTGVVRWVLARPKRAAM